MEQRKTNDMFDIKAYLEDRGVETNEGGTANTSAEFISIRCPNPFCGDHSNHCGIQPEELYFNCWKCGERGKIDRIVQWIEECSYREAKEIMEQFQKDELIPTLIKQEEKPKNKTLLKRLPKYATKDFPSLHKRYLLNRQYNPEHLIAKYDLYAVAEVGDFRWRIVIPYYLNKQIVTYSGKDVTGKSKYPYKHCPKWGSILDAKQTLYGIDYCKGSSCVVVEGVFDVWRIGDGAIATSGTQWTDEQLDMLLGYGFDRVLIAFDGDAVDKGERLSRIVSGILGKNCVKHIIIEHDQDPDTLSEDSLRKIRGWMK